MPVEDSSSFYVPGPSLYILVAAIDVFFVLCIFLVLFCSARRIRLGNLIGDSSTLVEEQKDAEQYQSSAKSVKPAAEDVGSKRDEKEQVTDFPHPNWSLSRGWVRLTLQHA